jgi:hypothetical protein
MKRSYLGIVLIILGIFLLIPMFRGLYEYTTASNSKSFEAVLGLDYLFFHFLMGIASVLLIWIGVRYVRVGSRS